MRTLRLSKKTYGFLLATIGTFCMVHAQQTDDDLDSIVYYLFFEDSIEYSEIAHTQKTYDYVYSTGTCNSQTYYHGREIDTPQWNISPQLSYYHHKGFGLSTTGIWYQTYIPHWSYTNISANYFSYVGKKDLLNYFVGYSRYFFSDGSDFLTNSIDASFGYRLKKPKIGTKISVNYSFGNGEAVQVINKTYWHIQIKKNKKTSISIRPQLSINYSELGYISETNDIIYTYGFLNTQIDIPLRIILQNFDFEIGYYTNMPIEQSFESNLPNTHALHVSIGYLFSIERKAKSPKKTNKQERIQERIESNTTK